VADETVARDLLETARELLAERQWSKLVTLVTSLHPADLADFVLLLEEDDRRQLLDELPTDIVGQLFEYVEDDSLRDLIHSIGVADLPAVLEEVEDDVAADVIQQLEPAEQIETLAALDRGEEVAELLQYGEDSAGGIMSHGFVALNEGISVQQAIDYLRVLRPAADRVYYLYVIDRNHVLQGTVSMRDLLVSSPRTLLGEITRRDVHAVTTGTDQEEAARTLQRYNLLALPVVDEEGRLEGVMTADDLIDVLQEEATEDMYRMVGVEQEERVFSPVATSVRRRLPWLLVNTFTAFLAAATVSLFDDTLARLTLLAFFMPVVAGQGGNAGTQTATIAVRSIALGDLDVRDIFRAARKEIVVGIANGAVVGLAAGLVAYAWQQNLALSIVLASALLLTVTLATLNGILIPLTLKAMKVDPALATNIFVTMLTDILGFFIFLGLAFIFIDQLT
jgi:magnesium transporter